MATDYTLRIDQGSRFLLRIEVDCDWITDLSGFVGSWKVRAKTTDLSELADLSDYVLTDLVNQQIVLDVPADVSSLWDWNWGVYDVEITGVAGTARILQGNIYVDQEVTR
jgi:hypothetical protein